jgi:hypothetical protein
MYVELKLTCEMADNRVGAVSRVLLVSNGVYHPVDRVLLEVDLRGAENHFVKGRSYGAAFWPISKETP